MISGVIQSTLFNAICEGGKAQAANFPFCTIEPNVGIVTVPDPRLQVSQLMGFPTTCVCAPLWETMPAHA